MVFNLRRNSTEHIRKTQDHLAQIDGDALFVDLVPKMPDTAHWGGVRRTGGTHGSLANNAAKAISGEQVVMHCERDRA